MQSPRIFGAAAVLASLTLVSSSARAQAAPAEAATAQPAAPRSEPWKQSPAEDADPPLLPPPAAQQPTSTSGTDVAPPSSPAPLPIIVDESGGKADEARARIRELETRLAVNEARVRTLEDDLGPLRHLKIQGYVQLQYQLQSFNAAASPNRVDGGLPAGISSNDVIAKTDGSTTNTNRFRLRRTRLAALYDTEVFRAFLQVELLPAGGPSATAATLARNAEVTGIARWSKTVRTEVTGGLFQVPFLLELHESSMVRPWIERTTASQNMFPSERDLGLHAKTFVNKDALAIDVGILNGDRLGERTFTLQPDLNRSKDFFATFTTHVGPLTGLLSGYVGRGHIVDSTALRVKNYGRLAANLGLMVAHPFVRKLGETKVITELGFGTNMDTGVNYAFAAPTIPPSFNEGVSDRNQRWFYVRLDQELTKWGIGGFRFDTYTTDSSLANNSRHTYGLMGGVRFSKLLRLVNEGTIAIDNIHADGASAPSKHVWGYTAWLQGSFY